MLMAKKMTMKSLSKTPTTFFLLYLCSLPSCAVVWLRLFKRYLILIILAWFLQFGVLSRLLEVKIMSLRCSILTTWFPWRIWMVSFNFLIHFLILNWDQSAASPIPRPPARTTTTATTTSTMDYEDEDDQGNFTKISRSNFSRCFFSYWNPHLRQWFHSNWHSFERCHACGLFWYFHFAR